MLVINIGDRINARILLREHGKNEFVERFKILLDRFENNFIRPSK